MDNWQAENDNPAISSRLRDRRRERDVTQEELAGAVGVSRQSIISLELGRCLPSVSLALAIARFFDSSIEEMFFWPVGDNIEAAKEDRKEEEENMDKELSHGYHQRKLDEAIDRMIDSASGGLFRHLETVIVPQMNVYQNDKEIIVEADVPGMSEDDIDIEITDGILTIKGERREQQEEKKKEYFYKELAYGSFQRAITLPVEIVADKTTAEVKKGQLKIAMPKVIESSAKVHKVKAKAA